jgi:hypothetical protein
MPQDWQSDGELKSREEGEERDREKVKSERECLLASGYPLRTGRRTTIKARGRLGENAPLIFLFPPPHAASLLPCSSSTRVLVLQTPDIRMVGGKRSAEGSLASSVRGPPALRRAAQHEAVGDSAPVGC